MYLKRSQNWQISGVVYFCWSWSCLWLKVPEIKRFRHRDFAVDIWEVFARLCMKNDPFIQTISNYPPKCASVDLLEECLSMNISLSSWMWVGFLNFADLFSRFCDVWEGGRVWNCTRRRHSSVFIVNFENISHLVLVFLLLTLNM